MVCFWFVLLGSSGSTIGIFGLNLDTSFMPAGAHKSVTFTSPLCWLSVFLAPSFPAPSAVPGPVLLCLLSLFAGTRINYATSCFTATAVFELFREVLPHIIIIIIIIKRGR